MFSQQRIARALGMKAKPKVSSRCCSSLSSLRFGAVTPIGDEPVNKFTFPVQLSADDLADLDDLATSPSQAYTDLILPLRSDDRKRRLLNEAGRATGVLYVDGKINNTGFVAHHRHLFLTCHHKGVDTKLKAGQKVIISFALEPEETVPNSSSMSVPARYLADLYHNDNLDVELWYLEQEPPTWVTPLQLSDSYNPSIDESLYGCFVNHPPRESDIRDFYGASWEEMTDDTDFHKTPLINDVIEALRPLTKVICIGQVKCGIDRNDPDLIKQPYYDLQGVEGAYIGVQISGWFGSTGGPLLVFEQGKVRVGGLLVGATVRNKNRGVLLGGITKKLIDKYSDHAVCKETDHGHGWKLDVCE